MNLTYNINTQCYDLKLSSDCNSGKDFNKSEGYDQLVKYKNTGMYLHYIYLQTMMKPYVYNSTIYKENRRIQQENNAYYIRH